MDQKFNYKINIIIVYKNYFRGLNNYRKKKL